MNGEVFFKYDIKHLLMKQGKEWKLMNRRNNRNCRTWADMIKYTMHILTCKWYTNCILSNKNSSTIIIENI